MTTSFLRRLFRFSVTVACLSSLNVVAAMAADASDWSQSQHSAVRLIAGTSPTGRADVLRAGVEVKLAPGWKTYWRYPGDSGVPPHFDFTRSRNVAAIEVAWPAPHRFTEAGGEVIGYKDGLILPLRVKPANAAEPVELDLKLDYAICEKLCVPVEATARLALQGGASDQDEALAAAEQRVPRPVALGEGSPAIIAVRREGERVVVDVAAPADMTIDLFAEGPTPDWALPLPQPVPGPDDGIRRFAFALDGLPPGAIADGAALRLTLVSPKKAIEVTYELP
jgi:DsbC/DsbD-like thiol-disulfide interchange protein